MFKFVVKLLSCIWLCDLMDCSMPGFPSLHYLPEFAQTHVHWVSDAIQQSHPLLPPSPPAFNISQHQGLLNRLTLCIRQSEYWNFIVSISPSNDYSRLISFRIDWFDALIVQGTLKSLSSTTVWKHQFFHAQPTLWPNIHTWLLEKL